MGLSLVTASNHGEHVLFHVTLLERGAHVCRMACPASQNKHQATLRECLAVSPNRPISVTAVLGLKHVAL
jgi:hypothetical protein